MSRAAPEVREERCPVCETFAHGGPAFRAEVPILLNVLVRGQEAARAVPTGELALHECLGCGFVWNARFEGVPYDDTYLVDPTGSPRYRAHLDRVADRVLALHRGPRTARVVDVGAGQGHFLAHLARRAGDRLEFALGLDPAHRVGSIELPPGVTMLKSRLEDAPDPVHALSPSVVVSRHVIEHVPDPVGFLRTIARTLGRDGAFALLIETPNVEHSLARGHLHDFCYEHCSMFGATALRHALGRAGFVDVEVDTTAFDGEYLLASARFEPGRAAQAHTHVAPPAPRLARLGERFVRTQRARLELARGPVVLWGGAGKGALFALLVDPQAERIAGVVDILATKWGHHLPGAGHPIIAPATAAQLGVGTVFVVNPTYRDEIRRQAREAGIDAEVCVVGEPG